MIQLGDELAKSGFTRPVLTDDSVLLTRFEDQLPVEMECWRLVEFVGEQNILHP